MSSEKSNAIVLRVIDFSESSCVVTLLTEHFGKITALAKGARRPKSAFEAAIDVLAICRIVFLHKSSDAMDLLTEAKLERRFRSSSTDLKRLYAGYYVIELLRVLTEENDPHPDLFTLSCQIIETIEDPATDPESLNLHLLQFELRTLKILGHLPMLTQCVGCGRERKTQNRVSFGLNMGGLLCETCRRGRPNVISLSPAGLRLLLSMAGNSYQTSDSQISNPQILNPPSSAKPPEPLETKHVIENEVDPKVRQEVRQLINQYITHLLGFTPRLHKFLKNL